MKAYLDTSVFIDYFVGRGHAGTILRATSRRGRSPVQLGMDADACFRKLATPHQITTSVLTFYEAEEAMFRELRRAARRGARAAHFIVPAARTVIEQMFAAVALHDIEILDLNTAVVSSTHQSSDLALRGIRAADALHLSTALIAEVDLLITADRTLLKLDSHLNTPSGKLLRILDTDAAFRIIE